MENKGPPYDVEPVEHWYWVSVSAEAWERTRSLVFTDGWHVAFTGFAIVLVGIGVVYGRSGSQEGFVSMQTLINGLIAGGIVWAALWLLYMLRIPAQRAAKTKKQLAQSVPEDAYNRVQAECEALRVRVAADRPEFWASIEQVGLVDYEGLGVVGFIAATITNRGAPGSVLEWAVYVLMEDGTKIVADLLQPTQPFVFEFGKPPSAIVIPGEDGHARIGVATHHRYEVTNDNWLFKLAKQPISKGGWERGYMPVRFAGTSYRALWIKGNKMVVVAHDTYGQRAIADYGLGSPESTEVKGYVV